MAGNRIGQQIRALEDCLHTLQQQVNNLIQTPQQSESFTQAFNKLHTQVSRLEHEVVECEQTEVVFCSDEARFQKLVSNMPGVVYRYVPCDNGPDVFAFVNSGARELFELEPETLIYDANSFLNLLHPDDIQSFRNSVAIAIEHSAPWHWEGRIITPSGQLKWIQGASRPETTADGDVWDGLLLDITERKRADEQIRSSLKEKEVLLKEIHHRVKNNLQIISSLLYLQSNRVADSQARATLQDSRNRIESMALVHESLYRSQNFAEINFTEYVRTLAANLFRAYNIEPDQIALHISVSPHLTLKLDQAVPCGLIVNELIANALQHGFHKNRRGQVFVTAELDADERITLVVGNNGDSLPENFNLHQTQSMGLRLVDTLVKQLRGSIDVEQGDTTRFKIILTVPT